MESGEAKDIASVLDEEPFLPPAVVALCQWVADYYMAGIGDAIGVAMPPGGKREASAYKTRRVVSATAHGLAALGGGDLTKKQHAALETLAGVASGLALTDLRDRGVSADVVRRLVTQGFASVRDEREDRDPFERAALGGVEQGAGRTLTGEQSDALDRLSVLADVREFRVALLHGVTGSGKTEIYL